MFGICNLAVIPVRFEPSDKSEITSQVLFGEHFEIIDTHNQWSKIRIQFDNYEGWVDSKQYQPITEEDFNKLSKLSPVLNGDFVQYITGDNDFLLPITLGASVSFLNEPEINTVQYTFDGVKESGIKDKSQLVKTAFKYLNAPYLWGGKTPFGIDCSGFTQMVYKFNGLALSRDASQQALQGETLSFLEEAEPGDLAFFDNAEGRITHVGIILKDAYIIHASGKVRIDKLDHSGIFNETTQQYTHNLRVVKKII